MDKVLAIPQREDQSLNAPNSHNARRTSILSFVISVPPQ